MIRKQDILDRAAEWRLRPEVVEKDYVLGWLLAGLASCGLRDAWVFKGGTCVKKTYFETYRFSEDLDFSLLPHASYDAGEIRVALVDLARIAHELSGIDFPEEAIEVRPRRNRQGQPTFQCRLGYRGPLAYPGPPRVLFDLTREEPVLDPPASRTVYHPYPDDLPEGVTVLTYSFNELLAEKVRALYERSRPRDLYDVVFLLENRPDAFDFTRVCALFREKCATKQIPLLSSAELLAMVRGAEELRSEWANMLGHQLSTLPDLDELLARLPDLLRWIDEPSMVPSAMRLPAPPVPAGAGVLPSPGIQYWGGGSTMETLRFAGANRLLVEFDYHGRHRRAEPYSLRQARTGNVLLYAWEEAAGHIKAFNVAEIRNLRPSSRSFTPRYRVELSSIAPPPVSTASSSSGPRMTSRGPRRARVPYGPTYVFECQYCQKRFRRTKNDPALRKHKAKDGYGDCPGRRGYLVEMR